MKIPFVWLGSKRAAKRGVGEKGALLDRAARARLPVPNGGILLHDFYELLLEAGIARADGARVAVDHATELYEALYTAVRFPRLSHETAVRAAFSTPDGAALSSALRLHVDPEDAAALTAALCAVWSGATDAAVRRDVIIQEMVQTAVSGTAVSRADAVTDEATATQGMAAALALPRLSRWERPLADLPPYAQRLQMLLRGVRHTFGHDDWRISWADDGRICWLLQLQPRQRSTKRESGA